MITTTNLPHPNFPFHLPTLCLHPASYQICTLPHSAYNQPLIESAPFPHSAYTQPLIESAPFPHATYTQPLIESAPFPASLRNHLQLIASMFSQMCKAVAACRHQHVTISKYSIGISSLKTNAVGISQCG